MPETNTDESPQPSRLQLSFAAAVGLAGSALAAVTTMTVVPRESLSNEAVGLSIMAGGAGGLWLAGKLMGLDNGPSQ